MCQPEFLLVCVCVWAGERRSFSFVCTTTARHTTIHDEEWNNIVKWERRKKNMFLLMMLPCHYFCTETVRIKNGFFHGGLRLFDWTTTTTPTSTTGCVDSFTFLVRQSSENQERSSLWWKENLVFHSCGDDGYDDDGRLKRRTKNWRRRSVARKTKTTTTAKNTVADDNDTMSSDVVSASVFIAFVVRLCVFIWSFPPLAVAHCRRVPCASISFESSLLKSKRRKEKTRKKFSRNYHQW